MYKQLDSPGFAGFSFMKGSKRYNWLCLLIDTLIVSEWLWFARGCDVLSMGDGWREECLYQFFFRSVDEQQRRRHTSCRPS